MQLYFIALKFIYVIDVNICNGQTIVIVQIHLIILFVFTEVFSLEDASPQSNQKGTSLNIQRYGQK